MRAGTGGIEEIWLGTPPDIVPAIWEQDWSIEPLEFKIYESLEPIALPREPAATSMSALEALAGDHDTTSGECLPNLNSVAELAYAANGLLDRRLRWRSGRVVQYRTAGCTGARYHLEHYFVCGDLVGLPAGVYHYGAHDGALRQLRAGDYRQALVEASGNEPAVARAPAVLVTTSVFWRNAWRYRARAYRHAFWDAGTALGQVLAVAATWNLPARVVFGYDDAAVARLLGIDGEQEAALALVALGRTSVALKPVAQVPALALRVRPVSARTVTFPEMGRMHRASSLASGEAAAAWRNQPSPAIERPAIGEILELERLTPDQLPRTSIREVIVGRRSTRHFAARSVPFDHFSTVLDRAGRPIDVDWPVSKALPGAIYAIISAVEGVPAGVYRYRPAAGQLELVRLGDARAAAVRLAARQRYVGDAAVNVYYLTNLEHLVAQAGERGYRVAQLLSALSASRLHLAASALGLGAVGSTSADDEVVAFFEPRAMDAYLFVTVFGNPARAPR
ncbi:MAG: SagB family peptide dehydrogenase [Chloroflexi bacterium]|nr:SagB family peptide dehydrogenase [Chloroflexota bacterium]